MQISRGNVVRIKLVFTIERQRNMFISLKNIIFTYSFKNYFSGEGDVGDVSF